MDNFFTLVIPASFFLLLIVFCIEIVINYRKEKELGMRYQVMMVTAAFTTLLALPHLLRLKDVGDIILGIFLILSAVIFMVAGVRKKNGIWRMEGFNNHTNKSYEMNDVFYSQKSVESRAKERLLFLRSQDNYRNNKEGIKWFFVIRPDGTKYRIEP